MNKSKHTFIWIRFCSFPVILLCILSLNCAPKVIYKDFIPEPHPYEKYSSKNVLQEIERLEKLLVDSAFTKADALDSTLYGFQATLDTSTVLEKIYSYLFDLHLHKSNPEPDFQKAYNYAEKMYAMGTNRKLYYLNWGRLLKSHIELIQEKDSLTYEMGDASSLSDMITSLKKSSRKQSKQIDSLQTLVTEQKETLRKQIETIKKLEKLELIMERRRSTRE